MRSAMAPGASVPKKLRRQAAAAAKAAAALGPAAAVGPATVVLPYGCGESSGSEEDGPSRAWRADFKEQLKVHLAACFPGKLR